MAMTRGRTQQLLAAAAAIRRCHRAAWLQSGRPTALQTLGDVTLVAIPLLPAEALQTPRSDLLLLSQSGSDLTERSRERERREGGKPRV